MVNKIVKSIAVLAFMVLFFLNFYVSIKNETSSATLGSLKAQALEKIESLPAGPLWIRCHPGWSNIDYPLVIYCGNCRHNFLNTTGMGYCQE